MRRRAWSTIQVAAGWLVCVLMVSPALGQGGGGQPAQSGAVGALGKALEPLREIASGQLETFTLEMTVEAPIVGAAGQPGGPKSYRVAIARRGAQEWSLSASDSPLGALALVRTVEATAIVDQGHKRVFIGKGKLLEKGGLEPGEFARRLAGDRKSVV